MRGMGHARFKIPESVLVVIHTAAAEVLLLERADAPGFWQSVTGSKDSADEPLLETCRREVAEETGIRWTGGRPPRTPFAYATGRWRTSTTSTRNGSTDMLPG